MTTTVTVPRGGPRNGWPGGLGGSDDNGDDALWETERAIEAAILHLAARRKHQVPGCPTLVKLDDATARTFMFVWHAQGYSPEARGLGIYGSLYRNQLNTFTLSSDQGGTGERIRSGTAHRTDDRAFWAVDFELDGGELGDSRVQEVTLDVQLSFDGSDTEGASLWGTRLYLFDMDSIEV